mgnify:CR=1 FL=1
MKKALLAAAFITLAASCKKQDQQSATIVRDCTGTYLRYQGKDYQVCNLEKLSSYADGAVVSANFRKIDRCTGSANDAIVCYMFHPNEGWIEVEKVY